MDIEKPAAPQYTLQDRYQLLVEGIVDYAIYMLDPTGVVTSWNRGAQRIKGYADYEIIGEHFSRFYTYEDRTTGLPARALAIAETEGRFEQEGWRVRKDGSLMWAHVLIDPIRSEDGTLLGFAKVTRDLSEQQATKEALRQSEQRFRLLVQGVQDYAIYMLDPNGQVTSWNKGAQRFKGYSDEEIIGEHFSRFYTDEDRLSERPATALRTAAQAGRFEAEGWRVRKDGSRFWANVVIDPIRGEHGELVGFAKITRDITERRDAQLALEETRARFIQSQKMEAIGQLTGGVAHDFNNLLAVILGNLNLALKRLPPDPKLRQLIDNSIQAADRGATLTKRMLAFARRQELSTTPVDVPDLIRGMSDLLQRSIGANIPVGMHFPLKLPRVLADANQLELVVLNLCVNARDATPAGGTITLVAREAFITAEDVRGLKPGNYVCLSVIDTGEGMDAETLAKAAEPFFTTKGVGKGTGLGLSMVHGFAEQSGGRLILKSTKGQGTTAELWLPEADLGNAPQTEQQPEDELPRLDPVTALVVDDDALVLMNTTAMLEDLGHTVVEATSGEQALRILRRSKGTIDLVITDQMMPGMTGTQLVEAIRTEHPDMVAILASGYTELPEDTLIPVTRLTKPFGQSELALALVTSLRPEGFALPVRPKLP
ncbi:hybrid sensor histidine kinase/response regulator [Methylobacterium gnaphalii]|uniref:histidine kinase n=1 Tax=Methylobacterium gnaphalii TaxID=1010610 RepID=A0A512JMJ1_9HYPH|nr:PAS domain-containing sensor histidine kinase [Methylobacterium gnaphalii]GEP11189.1 histidine kinase [Methylobacterium gnaphalii]GJD70058.1 Sensor histidine kinase RcsC [Methylobacterium gnaphalii]GLS49694.1 histidine kinase [Methylobacterium gnaphalii]